MHQTGHVLCLSSEWRHAAAPAGQTRLQTLGCRLPISPLQWTFRGAASACNAEVSLIDLHLMQVGPFDFTGVSSNGNPVLGEMKCPNSDDFSGSIMIQNLTSFSLPPSCRIVFPNHVAYASDRSFIRSAAGVEFRHPYPPSVNSGQHDQIGRRPPH